MPSKLYHSIFDKGAARGKADAVVRALTRRAGALDPAELGVAARILSVSSVETLDAWLDEALDLADADGARRLLERITARGDARADPSCDSDPASPGCPPAKHRS